MLRALRQSAALAALAALAACAPAADLADILINPVGENPEITQKQDEHHARFLVADLHADTLLWHKGLREASGWGQVTLDTLRQGRVGLQVFSMVTRNPVTSAEHCIKGDSYDPVPLLAAASGWPRETVGSAYQRALYQAKLLQDAIAARHRNGVELMRIWNVADLRLWLDRRFAYGAQNPQNPLIIGALLAAEGAHAFDPDLGPEFETLVANGLRMVSPTHHFTNAYGQSSERCASEGTYGLTVEGKRLVAELFARDLVVDVAHSSTESVGHAVDIAASLKRPLLASHTGVRNYLAKKIERPSGKQQQAIGRAMSSDDIMKIARTGGTVGITYWKDQIGSKKVDDVAGSILQAYCDLAFDNTTPLLTASEHVSLGSDWDGGANNALDASRLAAVTWRLKDKLAPDEIADIAGRNVCRVLAQSLPGRLDRKNANDFCEPYGPTRTETDDKRRQRQRDICGR